MLSGKLTRLFQSGAWRALCVTIGLLIFMTDALTPPGYAHGTLYLLLLLMAAATRDNQFITLMTGLCVLLAISGAALGPIQPVALLVANRTTSVLELICFAWACIIANRQLSLAQSVNADSGKVSTRINGPMGTAQSGATRSDNHAGAQPDSKFDFRQFADCMPHIIWVANPAGEVFYSNKALDDYAGVKQDHAAPRSGWSSAISPQDLPDYEAAWRTSVRESRDFSVQSRIRCHDGNYRWHLVQAHPVRDESGNISMWCGSAMDIHAIKQVQ